MAPITGFHHLSLTVTDLTRSAAWYQEVLGFAIDAQVEGSGFRRIRLRHPQAGITLTLTAHEQGPAEPFDERRTGLDHVALSVAGVQDVHDLKRRFEELGVDHSEVKPVRSGSGGLITLRDPDNIQLEIFTAGG